LVDLSIDHVAQINVSHPKKRTQAAAIRPHLAAVPRQRSRQQRAVYGNQLSQE
jgi:hypothetical protein